MKTSLLVLLALLSSRPLLAQKSTPVSGQDLMVAFHPAYAGKIQFSVAAVPANAKADPTYIGFYPYILSPSSKLFLTIFLSTSLTLSLHRFVPHVPLKELARSGTFQFSG